VPRALVVDDEKNIRTTLKLCLEQLGCEVATAANPAAALAEAARAPVDLAFVDLRLGEESGLELVSSLAGAHPDLTVIVITAYAEIATAVDAIKRGAWDFLPKPFTPAQIRLLVDKAVERRQLSRRVADLEHQIAAEVPEADLGSRAPAMRAALETVDRVAVSDASVLIRGENGTGKGVVARAIHVRSARHGQPFVVVNCPALSEELLGSELFGHVRGAFTGAVRDREGRVEAAAGGTLFLDEVGELPAAIQAKLLRFLQDREFERVGETRTRRADVRILAATNRDLEQAVTDGRFREDLLYRLNVVEIRLPPLRERREDIVPLARRFADFFARAAKRQPPELSRAAEEALLTYRWPGNVRELRNAIERALILWPARILEPHAFPDKIARPEAAPVLGGDYTLDDIEREHMMRVLARTGTFDEAAAILGIDASTLYRKRKRYED